MKRVRVHFSVFSTGLGHAKRDAALILGLKRKGALVTATASGEAALLLRPLVDLLIPSPVLDVGWGEAGDVSMKKTVRQLPDIAPLFARQVAVEARLVARADVVVADSKLSPYPSALALRRPLISLWNQLWLSSPPSAERQRLSWAEKAFGVLSLFAIARADEVLILDYPPPYTISHLNVVNAISLRRAKFVGPILDGLLIEGSLLERARRELGLNEGGFVLLLSGGPGPSRRRLTSLYLRAAEALRGRVGVVVVGAEPAGSQEPRRMPWGWYLEWCPYVEALMRLSELVVCRGGHHTLSWCLRLGKPCVVVPISKHSEQIGNARRMQLMGVGKLLHEATLTPGALGEAILGALKGPLHERAKEVARRVGNYSGLEPALARIWAYAHQG